MRQQDLFPMARLTDPLSSHRAADELEQSGALGRQHQEALYLVQQHPGSTALQLAGGDFRLMIRLRKRLPELRERGLVCSESNGVQDQKWSPV